MVVFVFQDNWLVNDFPGTLVFAEVDVIMSNKRLYDILPFKIYGSYLS